MKNPMMMMMMMMIKTLGIICILHIVIPLCKQFIGSQFWVYVFGYTSFVTFLIMFYNTHRALDKTEYLVIIRDNFC